MLAGIPGLFLGFLAFTQLQDKQRLSQKPAEIPHFKEYFALLKNRPFLFICLAHAMITFIIGGLSAWMPTYLHRYLQMDVARAGAVFGMLVVLCGYLRLDLLRAGHYLFISAHRPCGGSPCCSHTRSGTFYGLCREYFYYSRLGRCVIPGTYRASF